MSSSVKYSPVPAVLTRPELLAELNLLMTRIASGCRVGLPASGRPVIAVHGGYVSYSSPRTGHVFQDGSRPETVMTVSNRERMCEWFSQVWLPLHLAALYSAAIFLIPICISFDTAEKRRYATYLILNRRFSFEF